jgi:hypothetical protein
LHRKIGLEKPSFSKLWYSDVFTNMCLGWAEGCCLGEDNGGFSCQGAEKNDLAFRIPCGIRQFWADSLGRNWSSLFLCFMHNSWSSKWCFYCNFSWLLPDKLFQENLMSHFNQALRPPNMLASLLFMYLTNYMWCKAYLDIISNTLKTEHMK